ncbi:MAG: aminotransferase class V-fold PLP-dependent enzyme, partial [Patescibacteria group bacterium]
MKKRIFLDYAAGRDNPNAIYLEGRIARARLESARARIAKVLSVATDEIVFTPWGTEANIFSLGGLTPKSHIITTAIEHKSLLDAFAKFKNVTYLKTNSDGFITAKQVEGALRSDTRLVSIMYANNEIGTIQPIKEIARVLRRSGIPPAEVLGKNPQTIGIRAPRPLFHSDCVQAPGLLPLNMQSLGLDMASFSAPKFGGPAGVGFLYIRRGTVADSQPRDAGALPLVEEMAEALEKADKQFKQNLPTGQASKHLKLLKLRDYFIAGVLKNIRASLNGSRENRLANNANFIFPIDSELLVLELDRY